MDDVLPFPVHGPDDGRNPTPIDTAPPDPGATRIDGTPSDGRTAGSGPGAR